MAYEAMNHAGFLDTNMIVILNDNQQVGWEFGRGIRARRRACGVPVGSLLVWGSGMAAAAAPPPPPP